MLFDVGKSIELQTKKGRSIRNLQKPKILPHRIKMAEDLILDTFPEIDPSLIDKRREATALYNCHGMTFACRRTGIYETEDIRHILSDDGYRRLSDTEVREGDIVLYYDADISSLDKGRRIPVLLDDCQASYRTLEIAFRRRLRRGRPLLRRIARLPDHRIPIRPRPLLPLRPARRWVCITIVGGTFVLPNGVAIALRSGYRGR